METVRSQVKIVKFCQEENQNIIVVKIKISELSFMIDFKSILLLTAFLYPALITNSMRPITLSIYFHRKNINDMFITT